MFKVVAFRPWLFGVVRFRVQGGGVKYSGLEASNPETLSCAWTLTRRFRVLDLGFRVRAMLSQSAHN